MSCWTSHVLSHLTSAMPHMRRCQRGLREHPATRRRYDAASSSMCFLPTIRCPLQRGGPRSRRRLLCRGDGRGRESAENVEGTEDVYSCGEGGPRRLAGAGLTPNIARAFMSMS
ncbi:hypothetical protein BD309DRAFT_496117 [Dichomitus squalens]|nr:hypothetical protein BD309DRAFT_496117 [Dichomitus squalens]